MWTLKKYSSNKVDLYDYSEFHIVEIGKNFSFPIHRDTPNKLLSGVIYLSPEKNNGTFLFSDKKGNNAKEIKWKQNRALFFSRSENDAVLTYDVILVERTFLIKISIFWTILDANIRFVP